MSESIPKIVHYCWFGGKMPKKVKKNIAEWKSILKDYEFVEWNESNFDLNKMLFAKEAFENKKWAFVADCARLYALKEYGGIYLDTDVEVLKSFDDLLDEDKLIVSHESDHSICTAVMLSNKRNKYVEGFLGTYNSKTFVDDGQFQMKPNTELLEDYLKESGVKVNFDEESDEDDVHILPQTYLCGKNIFNYKLLVTERTYCIHQLDASWYGHFHKLMKGCKKIVRKAINSFDKNRG